MPSVNGFRADMRFAGDRLTLQQFGGNLSGGHFDVTGGLLFKTLVNPDIDLHFISHGDLLLRNEAVTVRADSDIKISGPLAAASVTGDIGITKSRVFKEVEIQPLELPGRPAPKPPPAPTTDALHYRAAAARLEICAEDSTPSIHSSSKGTWPTARRSSTSTWGAPARRRRSRGRCASRTLSRRCPSRSCA